MLVKPLYIERRSTEDECKKALLAPSLEKLNGKDRIWLNFLEIFGALRACSKGLSSQSLRRSINLYIEALETCFADASHVQNCCQHCARKASCLTLFFLGI